MNISTIKKITSLALATAIFSLAGCHKSSSSSLKINPDYLQITGRTQDSAGQVQPNVPIFISGTEAPIGTSGADGLFTVNLTDNDLTSQSQRETEVFGQEAGENLYLYSEISSDSGNLVGMSRALSPSERGTIDIGAIVLEKTVTITGNVKQLMPTGEFREAKGAVVRSGMRQGVAGDDGKFTITGLPKGEVKFFAKLESLSTSTVENLLPKTTGIALTENETIELTHPLVLFPSDTVAGWVTAQPQRALAELARSANPFRLDFMASASPMTQFIRFHHDRQMLVDANQQAVWQDMRQSFFYDFPGNGGQNLYVQFADRTRTRMSSIFIVNTTIDIFGPSRGVIIGDGSGLITTRHPKIRLDLPPTAMKMRLHHNRDALKDSPWVPAQPVTQYTFPVSQTMSSASLELYVQYADASDHTSLVYSSTTTLLLFPDAINPPFIINGGAQYTESVLAHLSIAIPKNAYQMRIFEMPPTFLAINSNPVVVAPFVGDWYELKPEFDYKFSGPGLKQVFLQFRDIDGNMSPLYSRFIVVLAPGTDEYDGFYINNGDSVTSSREVVLSFVPPEGAVGLRIAEGTPDFSENFIKLQPFLPYTLRGTGFRTIYLQYIDELGSKSAIYSQSILLKPFAGDNGSFTINNGNTATNSRILSLAITPPLGATEMMIDERMPGAGWQTLSTSALFSVSAEAGLKTIYIKFRNLAGDETTFIQRSIIYTP